MKAVALALVVVSATLLVAMYFLRSPTQLDGPLEPGQSIFDAPD